MDIAKSIDKNMKIKIIGIRPGEKLSEEMVSINESRYCYDIGNYYILLPNQKKNTIKYYKKKFTCKLVEKNFEYNSASNKDFLSQTELKKIILRN